MVTRYTLTAPPDGSPPRFNIAPLQHALIRTTDGVATMRWGLLPPRRGHGGKRAPHVTCATEPQLADTPLIRNAFKRQRGLVLADGFYAWRPRDRSQPLWLHVPDAADRPQPLGFAAVAATNRDDGQPSFALLVAPARVLLAGAAQGSAALDIDVDAPIVIDPADHAAWLDGSADAARGLIAPRPIGWRAEPVSTYVNAVGHDDARCVTPLRNPRQGQLF